MATGSRFIMIKSLYVRITLIFIATVVLCLLVVLVALTQLNRSQIQRLVENNMIESGGKIIDSYRQHLLLNEQDFNLISNYRIQIVNDEGRTVYSNGGDKSKRFIVTKEQIGEVLGGNTYHGKVQTGEARGPEHLLAGLPFRVNEKPYALFITPEISTFIDAFQKPLRIAILIALSFGCILILIVTRYIVKPLKQLTTATHRMAKGDFAIEMKTKRRDEIGVLTASFNEMAKELGLLEEMRRAFVSNVSHEFQSPLTSISGFSKALKHKKLDEARRLEYLTIIEEESERLSRLSTNLLRLSSLQYGRHPVNPVKYRLDEQLRRCIVACEPLWTAKELTMDLHLDEVSIEADEDLLNQVWINLIGNSIKFTPLQGVIRIKVIAMESSAVVTIADNGIGIPEEELGAIFQPFYKVDKSRDCAVKGNGLGLSIAKQVVDIHHGGIQATSRSGEGTAFTVTLPLGAGESR